MQFKTYKPSKFSQLIDCFWVLEHYGEPLKVINPPSQYLNLSFSLGSDYYDDSGLKFYNAVLEGLSFKSKRHTHFCNNKIVGVRFMPYGLYAFFPELTKYLKDNTCFLESIIGAHSTQKIINDLRLAKTEHEIVAILTCFLTAAYNRKKGEKTGLVAEGYKFFHCPDDQGSVNNLIKSLSSNYTKLNRHFSEITGVSTKKMERLVRFRKSLCNLTNTNLSLTQIGYKVGYFDQSHFIREFTSFMNMKPKVYQNMIRRNCNKSYKFNYNFSLL